MALDATARRIEPAGFTRVPALGVEEQRGNVTLDFADPGEACARPLNMLARQDRLAPMFGREREVERVLEVLCHLERSNSVMLLGGPGVAKTAIVEGLARRFEFELESIPLPCAIVRSSACA